MTQYSKKIKKQVICDFGSGIPCKNICLKYNISKSCLYNWIKLFDVKTSQ